MSIAEVRLRFQSSTRFLEFATRDWDAVVAVVVSFNPLRGSSSLQRMLAARLKGAAASFNPLRGSSSLQPDVANGWLVEPQFQSSTRFLEFATLEPAPRARRSLFQSSTRFLEFATANRCFSSADKLFQSSTRFLEFATCASKSSSSAVSTFQSSTRFLEFATLISIFERDLEKVSILYEVPRVCNGRAGRCINCA